MTPVLLWTVFRSSRTTLLLPFVGHNSHEKRTDSRGGEINFIHVGTIICTCREGKKEAVVQLDNGIIFNAKKK